MANDERHPPGAELATDRVEDLEFVRPGDAVRTRSVEDPTWERRDRTEDNIADCFRLRILGCSELRGVVGNQWMMTSPSGG